MTYAQAVIAIEAVEGLKAGVRTNMIGALRRAASLLPGAAGEAAAIDLATLCKLLDKLTPAKLGFRNRNSLSAFKSNLYRALTLLGFNTIPGRHQAKLTPAWDELASGIGDKRMKRVLSRFMHFASMEWWAPPEISDEHLYRFEAAVATRCAPSKTRKVVRNTVKAWNWACENVCGWPSNQLQWKSRTDWYYALDWSAFPDSFRQDVEAYLAQRQLTSEGDFLDLEENQEPIEPRTVANYRDGLKRAASIMVANGVNPAEITSLAALVDLPRARAVLTFLIKRLGRNDGGLLNLIAMLIYMVARDWVYRLDQRGDKEIEAVIRLEAWFLKTRLKKKGMSERTQRRLSAFNDPRVRNDYLQLPFLLMKEADKSPLGDGSARLARLALFMAIGIDTLLRPGNIVALDLEKSFQRSGNSKQPETFVLVPKTKNGLSFHGKLRPQTARMLSVYVEKYRDYHLSEPGSWLFPGATGQHWKEGRACQALKDICAKRLGIDVTPHLNRALGGKIILTANPGALVDVQNALLHKSFSTTRASYIHEETADVQQRYHAILTESGKLHRAEYM